jgi:hypothetical protein
MKQGDPAQLVLKKLADPMSLMNPGKVRARDEQVLGIGAGQWVRLGATSLAVVMALGPCGVYSRSSRAGPPACAALIQRKSR